MTASGPAIVIGGLRIPAFAAGLTVSIAVHAGLLALLGLVPSGDGRSAAPPVVEFAIGEPVQVRIAPVDVKESSGRDEAAVGLHREDEPENDAPVTSPVDDERAVEPPEPHQNETEASPPQPSDIERRRTDWDAVIGSLRAVGQTLRATSSRQRSAETESSTAPRSHEHQASSQAAASESSEDGGSSANEETPRSAAVDDARAGIDRGVTIVDLPQPRYPPRSVRLGQEGTAVVAVTVTAEGAVDEVHLDSSSGHQLLDGAAIAAARRGRFRPALRDGEPLSAVVMIPFEFRLTR